eukprot:g38463.t1
MSSRPSAKRTTRTSGSTQASQQTPGGAGVLRFYSEDAPGLKIGPTAVLVLSLLFIGFLDFEIPVTSWTCGLFGEYEVGLGCWMERIWTAAQDARMSAVEVQSRLRTLWTG